MFDIHSSQTPQPMKHSCVPATWRYQPSSDIQIQGDIAPTKKVWDEVREQRGESVGTAPINYDWFVLALNLLFMVNAVTFENGLLRKAAT